jgi:hypothetical protein
MLINDLPKRARIEREIGRIAGELTRQLEQGDVAAREMILACRQILDLWVESGGASTDDEVIGVLGIESQCDHVMLRPGQRKPRFPEYDHGEDEEIDRLGDFFRDAFAREMRELAERFGASGGRM